jgi:hypothetical protein
LGVVKVGGYVRYQLLADMDYHEGKPRPRLTEEQVREIKQVAGTQKQEDLCISMTGQVGFVRTGAGKQAGMPRLRDMD